MGCFVRVLYTYLFFDYKYLISTKLQYNISLTCNYTFFYLRNKFYVMLGSRFLSTLVILVIACKCFFKK